MGGTTVRLASWNRNRRIGMTRLTERSDVKALAAASDCLVKNGILERESGPDGRLRYRKAKRGR